MIEKTIAVDRMETVMGVFGSFDQNLRIIEENLSVSVVERADQIHITGEAENVMLAERAISSLLALSSKGENIDAQNVRYILKLVREGKEDKIGELAGDVICITAKGKPIKPKTLGQKEYCEAIANNTVTLGIGPAGTGKTYLAVALAVAALKRHEVGRIVLARPVVEAGESLGYLPGTLEEKLNPYVRPLYDALFDMTDMEKGNALIEQGIIEIAPLAFMRGRTMNDAFVILDEAQNTTPDQMKMFLTRLGFGSKFVVTGDLTQRDLPGRNGLESARAVLGCVDDVSFVDLGRNDIVRHSLVARIVDAYDRAQGAHAAGRETGRHGE